MSEKQTMNHKMTRLRCRNLIIKTLINVGAATESFMGTYMLIMNLASGNFNHQVRKLKHNVPHQHR